METMFYPRSVAIIGASDSPSNVARGIIENLDRFAFKPPLYLIGSKPGLLLGRTIYSDMSEIPEVPDLAVILIPASDCQELLNHAVKKAYAGLSLSPEDFRSLVKTAKVWRMRF